MIISLYVKMGGCIITKEIVFVITSLEVLVVTVVTVTRKIIFKIYKAKEIFFDFLQNMFDFKL